jgi:hypothetical protein
MGTTFREGVTEDGDEDKTRDMRHETRDMRLETQGSPIGGVDRSGALVTA